MHTVRVTSATITPLNPSGVAGEDSVTLTCTGTLSGPAIARVEWTGQMMRTPPLATSPSTTVRDSLTLTRLRQSYAGTYTCTVTIGASSMSRSVTLAVTGESAILISELFIMLPSMHSTSNTYLNNGESVTCSCSSRLRPHLCSHTSFFFGSDVPIISVEKKWTSSIKSEK